MLSIHSIAIPQDQRDVFKTFEPTRETWLVSDLKSKLDLNRDLLKQRVFIPGESVMRASELWRTMLARLRPDLQIVSREFILTLLSHKLTSMDLDWVQAPGAAKAAYDYMTQLMPVLSHPDGEEMMREWFVANESSKARWGRWFDLSVRLWKEFLEDGFVAAPWASGVLTNEPDLAEVWQRPLIIDLGAELDQVEADLLVQLSSAIDIRVLRPEPTWAAEYSKALSPYEIFERKLKVQKTSPPVRNSDSAAGMSADTPPRTFCKYTTMIAEVKDAVSQAREWLNQGALRPSQIAIVAPDIEVYWPGLSSYIEQEGIPSQKDHVRRLHTYPDVSRWLAILRLRTGAYDEADVEHALFDDSAPRLMNFERFKTIYSTLYGREDLERSDQVAKRFHIDLRPGDESSRDDFVAWSLRQLPENTEFTRVESLFKRLFAECPQGLRLAVKRWMSYLEQLASKVECRIRDGSPDGLACINLSSAENSPATHMIVLGLTEAALKPSGGTAILFSDILSLGAQFGFHLSSDDQSCLEFEARWVIEDKSRELWLTVPETDFAGGAQAPSWLWVKGARESGELGKLTVPRATRWDELQKAPLSIVAEEKAWTKAHLTYLERSLKEDLGEQALENFGQGLIETLSPSAIEDYLECPFIFAAKRIFSLTDVAELDLEVDASRRGSLMHKVFELLTKEPIRFDYTDEDYVAIVEKAREASGIEFADPRLWPPLRARQVDLARRFMAFEQEIRRNFPQTETVAREADIAGFLDIESGELMRDKGVRPTLKFIGRIDRIDRDKKDNFAVFDYKSSAASAAQFGSWLRNNKIQLLLYAMAVEKGLTIFDPHSVVGAFYYLARPLGRDYGFKVDDVEQSLFEIGDKRKKNRIAKADKEKLFDEAKIKIVAAIDGILAGRFAPNPRDKKDCVECQWSPLCRAPHLMR